MTENLLTRRNVLALAGTAAAVSCSPAPKYARTFNDFNKMVPGTLGLDKSVLFAECIDPKTNTPWQGSVIVLDKETVVLTGHQLEPVRLYSAPLNAFYAADPNSPISVAWPEKVRIEEMIFDDKTDFAFGTISPHDELIPATWDILRTEEMLKSEDDVFVGYSAGDACLATGIIKKFADKVDLYDDENNLKSYNCKFLAFTPIRAGTSGGGVFRNKKCIGLINAGGIDANNKDNVAYITPAYPILEAFARYYPERAKRMPQLDSLLTNTQMPPSCYAPQMSKIAPLTSLRNSINGPSL